jgi:hypothetical protein
MSHLIRETAEAETVPAVDGHMRGAAIEEAMGCILSRLIPLKGAPVGDDRIGTRKANPSAGASSLVPRKLRAGLPAQLEVRFGHSACIEQRVQEDRGDR